MEEKKNNKPLFVKMMVLYLLLVLGIGGAMLASTIKTQVIDGEMYYGFVNANAVEMLPCVFPKEEWAFKAYRVYRNEPLHEFDDIDRYRLPLKFSTRERTYQLTDIVPDKDWDF